MNSSLSLDTARGLITRGNAGEEVRTDSDFRGVSGTCTFGDGSLSIFLDSFVTERSGAPLLSWKIGVMLFVVHW